MTDQMTLVKLTDKERIDLGYKSARLAAELEQTREEFSAMKKDYSEKLLVITKSLMETLHVLGEQP